MSIVNIDSIIIVLYLLSIFLLGILSKTKTGSIRSYGRADPKVQNHLFILIAYIFAAAVGGGTVFGTAEQAFRGNLSYTYTAILTVSVNILIGIIIVPRLSNFHDSISVGDITAKFYGQLGRVATGIAAFLVAFGYIAAQINISSKILHYVLNISYFQAAFLSYIVTIASIIPGGFQAVLTTSILQSVIITLGIPLLTIFTLRKTELFYFWDSIPAAKVSIMHPEVFSDTLWLTISFSVMGLYPSFIQRCLINKNYTVTSKAVCIKAVVYIIFILIISLNGLLAYYFFPDLPSSQAICHLIDKMMPRGLKGIVLIGFLSATMSTASAELNIASLSLVNDILKPLTSLREVWLVRIARLSVITSGTLAIATALYFENVMDLIMFIAGFWLPVMLVSIVTTLYDIYISKIGFIASILAGIISFFAWHHYYSHLSLKPVFIGVMSNLLVFMLFYLKKRIQRAYN